MSEWIDVNLKWNIPFYKIVLTKDYEKEFLDNYKDERSDELSKRFSNHDGLDDLEIEMDEILEKLDIEFEEEHLNEFKKFCKNDELIKYYECRARRVRKSRAYLNYMENNKEYQKEISDGSKCFTQFAFCNPGIQIEVKKEDGSIVKYVVGDINILGSADFRRDGGKGIEDNDIVLRYRKLF
jgi:hypothetical protein